MSKDYDFWENGFTSLVNELMDGGLGSQLDYQEAEGDEPSVLADFNKKVQDELKGKLADVSPYAKAGGAPAGRLAGIDDEVKSMLPTVAGDDPGADAQSPFAVAQQMSRDLTQFKPLDIDTADEFGKRYAQQIHKLADANNIGDYIGYTLSAKEKLIQLIGTKAILTINFHLDPMRISTLNR